MENPTKLLETNPLAVTCGRVVSNQSANATSKRAHTQPSKQAKRPRLLSFRHLTKVSQRACERA